MKLRPFFLGMVLFLQGGMRCYGRSDDEARILVEFRKSTPKAEALWILESYGRSFTFYPEHVTSATLTGTNAQELVMASKAFTEFLRRTFPKDGRLWTCEENLPDLKVVFRFSPELIIGPALRAQASQSLQGTSADIAWTSNNASGMITVDAEQSDVVGQYLATEPAVQIEVPWSGPNSSAYSVDYGTTVQVAPTKVEQRTTFRKPEQRDLEFATLPSVALVRSALQRHFSLAKPVITVEENEIDDEGEYLRISVSHLHGSITKTGYWERLTYSLPIYRSSPNTIKIRCILEGELAPGVGEHEPARGDFVSMEPKYAAELQEAAKTFTTFLVDNLRRKQGEEQ